MTERELRRRLCDAAEAWLGCRESDGSHRPIIDRYNAIRPLPGGYRMKYTDPWCAAFVSAAGAAAGLSEIVLPECSCERMRALYQAAGRFREADDAVPRPGDLVLYDWQDSGVGDCRGEPDHVGVVLSLTGELMKVAEGNKSDAVGLRTVPLNSRYIRGFCLPDYGKLASPEPPRPADRSAGKSADKSAAASPDKTAGKSADPSAPTGHCETGPQTGRGDPSSSSPSASPGKSADKSPSASPGKSADKSADPSDPTGHCETGPQTGRGNPSSSSPSASPDKSPSASAGKSPDKSADPSAPSCPCATGPQTDRGDPSSPCPLALLRRGSRGETVRAAQLLLIGRGFRCGPWGADGEFGDATHGAVWRFQTARRLAADGVIGPETWRALLGGGEGG